MTGFVQMATLDETWTRTIQKVLTELCASSDIISKLGLRGPEKQQGSQISCVAVLQVQKFGPGDNSARVGTDAPLKAAGGPYGLQATSLLKPAAVHSCTSRKLAGEKLHSRNSSKNVTAYASHALSHNLLSGKSRRPQNLHSQLMLTRRVPSTFSSSLVQNGRDVRSSTTPEHGLATSQ